MTGSDQDRSESGVQGQGSLCDRCRQPGRLVYAPAPSCRGRWLCPACLYQLDALAAGKPVSREKMETSRTEARPPGLGAAAGCALAFCLVLLWLIIGLAALLHGH